MKILYVTTVGKTMGFFKTFLEELIKKGHTVDIACNEEGSPVPSLYRELGCGVYPLSCSRSPLTPANLKAVKELRHLVETNGYDLVHCHTPIAAACTRLACRKLRKKQGLKVFYTAHGFHFYKGAPFKNWLIYYPVEKLCAHYTDKLITINQEDYALAQKKMKAKEVLYVPGVGINIDRFRDVSVDRSAKRRELGIPEDAVVLLSVGELNANKNQQVVIQAMAKLHRSDLHYMIAGVGSKADDLIKLAESLGIAKQVHLLGYRTDVAELYRTADAFVFPSYREGLSVSIMEAMTSGLPCAVSRIRGNTDLVSEKGGSFFSPYSTDECAQAIREVLDGDMPSMGQTNQANSSRYSIDAIINTMKLVYES